MSRSLRDQLRDARHVAERAEQGRRVAVERANVYDKREHATAARAAEAQARAEKLADRLRTADQDVEPLRAQVAELSAALERATSELAVQTAAAEGKAETEAALAVTQESLSTAEADRTRLTAQVEDLQMRLTVAEATAQEATARAATAEAHAASVVEEHTSAFDERRREMNRLRREHEKATQAVSAAEAELEQLRSSGLRGLLRGRR